MRFSFSFFSFIAHVDAALLDVSFVKVNTSFCRRGRILTVNFITLLL